jgi:hypothetical protein
MVWLMWAGSWLRGGIRAGLSVALVLLTAEDEVTVDADGLSALAVVNVQLRLSGRAELHRQVQPVAVRTTSASRRSCRVRTRPDSGCCSWLISARRWS